MGRNPLGSATITTSGMCVRNVVVPVPIKVTDPSTGTQIGVAEIPVGISCDCGGTCSSCQSASAAEAKRVSDAAARTQADRQYWAVERQKTKYSKKKHRTEKQKTRDVKRGATAAHHLEGVVAEAMASRTSGVTIPTGVRAASGSVPGLALVNVQALQEASAQVVAEEREDDPAEKAKRSAEWAVRQGLLPHPDDLAVLLDVTDTDASWASRFRGLAAELERIDQSPQRHPAVAAKSAAKRIGVLSRYRQVLDEYGPERLVQRIAQPSL